MTEKRPKCKTCEHPVCKDGVSRYTGEQRYSPYCGACRKQRTTKHRKAVLPYCERCGFTPEDICQIDVDHKNSRHADNSADNLWSLCACCHRLKTRLAKQGKELPEYRGGV